MLSYRGKRREMTVTGFPKLFIMFGENSFIKPWSANNEQICKLRKLFHRVIPFAVTRVTICRKERLVQTDWLFSALHEYSLYKIIKRGDPPTNSITSKIKTILFVQTIKHLLKRIETWAQLYTRVVDRLPANTFLSHWINHCKASLGSVSLPSSTYCSRTGDNTKEETLPVNEWTHCLTYKTLSHHDFRKTRCSRNQFLLGVKERHFSVSPTS